MPRPATAKEPANDRASGEALPRDGILDPMALVALLARNILTIALIAAVITGLGVATLLFYPFPYKATAIVLADPRDQRVTLQEDVLPAIGADAAVLESMVQIVKSDSFLLAAMQELGVIGAPADMSQTERLKALGKFRNKLTVERKGATYLVEISYSADDPEQAARVANGIAGAFAESQNRSRSVATENAARSLATRLVELRAKLNQSEEAVAAFKAEHGLVFIDQNNTLQMRQLTELSQQLALAKNATEEARARYDEVKNSGSLSIPSQQNGESGQLAFLRQQRAELAQSLDQQRQIYGPRHPRIVQTQQMLRGLDNQIAEERRLLEQQLKATLDVAAAKQVELEKQIASLSSGVNLSETARVELDALEREAAADREIYQQFLSRNKQTDELALLVEDNVRIVSEAVPPLRSTRPSLVIAGPAIALLGLAIATFVSVGRNIGSAIRPAPRMPRPEAPALRASPPPARRPVEMRDEFFEPVRRAKPVPVRDPLSLLDAWEDEDSEISRAERLRKVRNEMAGVDRGSGKSWLGERLGWRRAS
ncbi:MAG: GumC family protein [Rhizobiaceae bacterium]|nr:GumC family protein [Rhizobiaceae bacterium]